MKEDIVLLAIVFVVWALLALLYATVPMFSMPGYAAVWGWGSLVFLALAVLIWVSARARPHPHHGPENPPAPEGRHPE